MSGGVVARRVGTTTGAKKKADRLFSLIIRATGHCENPDCDYACPCPDFPRRHTTECRLQCAHIRARRFSSTRCDQRNALALCAGCHHYYTDHPYEWAALVDEVQGAGVYDELRRDSHGVVNKDWLVEVERLTAIARERGILG